MKRLVLTQPVEVAGHDFWGRRASIRFEPAGAPGWFWRAGAEDIPLTPDILVHRRQRLVLAHKGDELHIVEHLLALRVVAGIDGLRIVSPTAWVPFDGSAEMFWRALRPALEIGSELVSRRISGNFSAGGERPVAFSGDRDEGLAMTVAIDYPGLGAVELAQSLSAARCSG